MLATQLSGCPWNSLVRNTLHRAVNDSLGHSRIKSIELSEYRLPGSCHLMCQVGLLARFKPSPSAEAVREALSGDACATEGTLEVGK